VSNHDRSIQVPSLFLIDTIILPAQQPFFHQATSMDAADILRKNDIR
jgi:hypothetical protein